MAWAAEQLVLVCGDRTVRFIDPQALRVVATVDYNPAPVGVAVAADQETVYVVTADLSIVAISARTHTVVRKVTIKPPRSEEFGSILTRNGVAMSADGRHLIVGVMAVPRATDSAFSLYVIDVPSLDLSRTVRLPRFASFVAAPRGGLYLFQSNDSHSQDWGVELTNPDFSQITRLTSLDGPLHRLVP
jgi:hypothetical protein